MITKHFALVVGSSYALGLVGGVAAWHGYSALHEHRWADGVVPAGVILVCIVLAIAFRRIHKRSQGRM